MLTCKEILRKNHINVLGMSSISVQHYKLSFFFYRSTFY